MDAFKPIGNKNSFDGQVYLQPAPKKLFYATEVKSTCSLNSHSSKETPSQ
jgi:hypothetical protein